MFKRNRILLLSASIILVCCCLIIGGTYALFTEEARISNHLKAGNLTATLTRQSYSYTYLDGNGVMQTVNSTAAEEDMDFSDANAANFFGLQNNKIDIVPGCKFEAVFSLGNAGTTAFNYAFSIEYSTENDSNSKKLAELLDVEIGKINGTTRTKIAGGKLNNITFVDSSYNADHIIVGGETTNFYVVVSLPHATTTEVENGQVYFDFVVSAEQYTGQ